MIRLGKIIQLEKDQGMIVDENEQDIPFDTLDCPDGLYIGAEVSFRIILALDGLMAAQICLLNI